MYKRLLKKRVIQAIMAIIICIACVFYSTDTDFANEQTATITDAEPAEEQVTESAEEQKTEPAEEQVTEPAEEQVTEQAEEQVIEPAVKMETIQENKAYTEQETELETEQVTILATCTDADMKISDKKYDGTYDIDYILSHYSYFIKNDLIGDHVADTIGSIVVGNRLELKNTVGKVKAAASYARYLIDLADYHTQSWNNTDGIDTNFYYEESYMTYKEWLTNRMVQVQENYIDMEDAFQVIDKESRKLLEKGKESKYDAYFDNNNLIIDFKNTNSVCLSKEDFIEAKKIIIKNVSGEDLLKKPYTISVEGKSDFVLDSSKIEVDGKSLNNNYFYNMVKYREQCVQNGQYYYGGFGLLWNFPDANTISAHFLAGNLLAPNGTVTLRGGNHEGQVIAQNVVSHSESHFYPYCSTTEETTTEETTTEETTTEETTTEETTTEETTTEETTTEETTTEETTTEETTTEETTTEETTTEETTTEETTTEETTTENEIPEPIVKSTSAFSVEITTNSTQYQPQYESRNESSEVKTGDTVWLEYIVICLFASAIGILWIGWRKKSEN